MRVAFRVDAGVEIGGGHVMRCLALADALRRRRAKTLFVCRKHPGCLGEAIARRGHEVRWLPATAATGSSEAGSQPGHADWLLGGWRADAAETMRALDDGLRWDWLVVDHYGIDRQWEEALAPVCNALMVIDDLADRPHACAVLLDQNPDCGGVSRYGNLVGSGCVRLLGPRFALLRPEFARAHRAARTRQGTIECMFIFAGMSDPHGLTVTALKSLEGMRSRPFETLVVAGSSNGHLPAIGELCSRIPRASLHVDTADMAALMARADLAIGAPGSATWERCAVGLPSLLVSFASNQERICCAADEAGIAVCLGSLTSVSADTMRGAVEDLQARPLRLRAMSAAALALVDGKGAMRVASQMIQSPVPAHSA